MGNEYKFYSGGYSSLSSDYGNFIGYRLNSAGIGSPTGIQTANQVNEVVSRIREGVKNVEVQAIQPEVFEQIPKQHFKEMSQVSRLAGVKTSVHAPIIDPAGFGEKGYEGERARIDAEQRLWNVIEKAHELDEKGKVPVVMHSTAGIPGTTYKPGNVSPGEKGRFNEHRLILINQETRELVPLEEERKYYPGKTTKEEFRAGDNNLELGGTLRIPREDIDTLNVTEWDNKITNLAVYKKNADEIIKDAPLVLKDYLKQPNINEVKKQMNDEEKIALNQLENAGLFLDNVRMSFNSIFHKAYKYGTPEQRKELEVISEEYKEKMDSWYVRDPKSGALIANPDKPKEPLKFINAPLEQMKVLDESIRKLHEIASTPGGAPQVYKPVEDFAMEKAAETFGNLAYKSVKTYKENAPFLAIENMYQGMAFSRAEDMERLIDASRKKFVENAVKDGMKKKDAEKKAEEFIGMTLDVGHLNMMRKHGFTEEDVVKEAGKMAKMVKHVHLTDNFGYSDSHLPPGMGNVPTKQILEQLEKAGKLKDGRFTDARAIVEAGAFVQHFKKSPYTHVLSAFGSPIFGPGRPNYTGVMDMQGGYFGSPLAYLPEKHFATYGSGFSGLPTELGGQMPGTQSRFSGTPNS